MARASRCYALLGRWVLLILLRACPRRLTQFDLTLTPHLGPLTPRLVWYLARLQLYRRTPSRRLRTGQVLSLVTVRDFSGPGFQYLVLYPTRILTDGRPVGRFPWNQLFPT